jgi:protein-tyrosine phosphatase
VVAVILRAVGVPPDVILEDYLLSNNRLEGRIDRLSFLASLGSLFRIPRSEIRPLLEVRQEYLEAAFAAIDEKYGSFDAYLEEGLGLNSDTLARLRYALLE